MRLSIVTICYNNADGLRATIDSVAAQTMLDGVEHIIVDGGSTDGSVDVIKEYVQRMDEEGLRNKEKGKRIEVKWVSERDRGIYNAMNKGIRMAEGDYCLFLNSGDVLARPDVLSCVLPILSHKPSTINDKHVAYDIYYGDVVKVKGNKKRVLRYKDQLTADDFVSPYPAIHHQAAFIRRDLFESIGLYREDMYIAADWYFFFDAVIMHKASIFHMHDVIAICDMTGLSNTLQKNDPRLMHDAAIRQNAMADYCAVNGCRLQAINENIIKRYITKIRWRLSVLLPLSYYTR